MSITSKDSASISLFYNAMDVLQRDYQLGLKKRTIGRIVVPERSANPGLRIRIRKGSVFLWVAEFGSGSPFRIQIRKYKKTYSKMILFHFFVIDIFLRRRMLPYQQFKIVDSERKIIDDFSFFVVNVAF